MKRGIITINGKTVTLSASGNGIGNENGNEIWMHLTFEKGPG